MQESKINYSPLPIIDPKTLPVWEKDLPISEIRKEFIKDSAQRWRDYSHGLKRLSKNERQIILPPEHLRSCEYRTKEERKVEINLREKRGSYYRRNSLPSSLPSNYVPDLAPTEDVETISAPEKVVTEMLEAIFSSSEIAEFITQVEFPHGLLNSQYHLDTYGSSDVASLPLYLDSALTYPIEIKDKAGKTRTCLQVINIEIDGKTHAKESQWDLQRTKYISETIPGLHGYPVGLSSRSKYSKKPSLKTSLQIEVFRVKWNPENRLKKAYLPFPHEPEIQQSLLSLELRMYVLNELIPDIINSLIHKHNEISNFIDYDDYNNKQNEQILYFGDKVAKECINRIRRQLYQIVFAMINNSQNEVNNDLAIRLANLQIYTYLTNKDIRSGASRMGMVRNSPLHYYLQKKIYDEIKSFYGFYNQIAPETRFKDLLTFKNYVFGDLAGSFRYV